MNERGRLIARVRKLLNLSTSSNEHEAAAAAAKAHALLAEHNLAMVDVEHEDVCNGAATTTVRTRQRLEKWAYKLARRTADAFDCEYYHATDGITHFVGVGADPEVCAWAFGYLYRTLLRMASTYMRTRTRLRLVSSWNNVRSSYLLAATEVIGRRLQEQKRQAPVTSDALVPIKEEAVKAAMPDGLTRAKFREHDIWSDAVRAGAAAAHNIPLSTPVNGRPSTAIQ